MVLINDCHKYDTSLDLVLFVLVWYHVFRIMMVLMLLLSRTRRTVVHPTSDFMTRNTPHVFCDTLRHTATHCNTLQHTATHCNTLQHTATHCNTLQHTATHCHTLQQTAAHCNKLQDTVIHCRMLRIHAS